MSIIFQCMHNVYMCARTFPHLSVHVSLNFPGLCCEFLTRSNYMYMYNVYLKPFVEGDVCVSLMYMHIMCAHTHTHTHTGPCSECLVRPSFVVKLLNTCMQMNHHEIEVFSVHHSTLQQFPIIRAQLLNHRMAGEMHVTEQTHQNAVIEWMKHLEVVYSLGKYGEREIFFIPYLATHSRADSALYSWSDAVAEEFKDASVVLYAQLSILATQQFFYRLIASLLTDILQNPSITRCFINLGCTEAIIPLSR